GVTYYDQVPAARQYNVKGYFCPSRRNSKDGLSVSGDVPTISPPGWPHAPGGLSDYAVVVDPSGTDSPSPVTTGANGAFRINTGLKFSDFTDGQSNTLMVGEKHVAKGREGTGWTDCSTYNGNYGTCFMRSAARAYPLTTNPNDTGWKFGSRH